MPPPEPLPRIEATAYLTPLREGGSLPGLVEADDLGTYVVKFTGAGQGPKALVAEIVVGELGRAARRRGPRAGADRRRRRDRAGASPTRRCRSWSSASAGLNLAIDFLPGSVGYDRGFDVPVPSRRPGSSGWTRYVANVDRSARNTNLLIWHRALWAIDHGACLRFHHAWGRPDAFATSAYHYDDHVLGRRSATPGRCTPSCAEQVTPELLAACSTSSRTPGCCPTRPGPTRRRRRTRPAPGTAYADYLLARLAAAERWLP